jgi:glucose-1-phosphate cytidylyltransferase
MVPIGGKPVLWHIMKIYSHYGFNDFIVALGVKGEIIKDYFFNFEVLSNDFTVNLKTNEITYHNKHDEAGWKVTLIDTGLNTLKGGRIKRIEKYLDDEINMLTYGDGVANINIQSLLEYHKNHNKTLTITGVNAPSRFGELVEEGGKVQSFMEKPQMSVGIVNGGYMVFNRNLLEYLSQDENCDFEFGVLEELAQSGEVMVYKHTGQWDCMDHERDVQYLNKLWNENKAFWKIW